MQDDSKLLADVRTLAGRYDSALSTMWRILAEPDCPPAIKLGPKTPRWEVTAIDDYMRQRAARFAVKNYPRRKQQSAVMGEV